MIAAEYKQKYSKFFEKGIRKISTLATKGSANIFVSAKSYVTLPVKLSPDEKKKYNIYSKAKVDIFSYFGDGNIEQLTEYEHDYESSQASLNTITTTVYFKLKINK